MNNPIPAAKSLLTRCPKCMRETLLTNPTTGQQLCVKKHSCGYEWHPEECTDE